MITITLQYKTIADAVAALEKIDTPGTSVVVELLPSATAAGDAQGSERPEQEPAPAVAPSQVAPRPRGRPRKEANAGAVNAPVETTASQSAGIPAVPSQVVSVAAPPAAAPAAASSEFKPPLGPTFTLDKPKTAAPVPPASLAEDKPTPAPAAAVPSVAKVQEAIEAVLAAKGTGAAMATLSRYGVKRSRELLEEQRAEFIAYAQSVVAGKTDPAAGTGA